ncbi:MAG TPA: hypothetical protein VFA83_17270 [Acidimicrobiales bacterium]|nr:hypothetical protein [Acidimicrobiales bacterium]
MIRISSIARSSEGRLAAAATLALVLVGLFAAAPPARAAGTNLVGTFALTPGTCPSGGATGTYFRMVQPSGTVAKGPFVSNGDSTCADKTYTLLAPGSDGGAVSGGYQPAPSPAFDGQGNSLANRIVVPAVFFGVRFGLSTDPKDRQTGASVTPLAVQVDPAGKLSGDLRAWEATWNKQDFNQGSPKPDGSTPKLTTPAHGTYDAATGAFVLEWTSTIAGGPFNDFTGSWHLAGTFRPAGSGGSAPASAPAVGAGQPSSRTRTSTVVPGSATQSGAAAQPSTDSASAPTEAAPASGGAKVVGAVKEKGWKPPAWLIVVTAIVGVGAALALLVPNRRVAPADTSE